MELTKRLLMIPLLIGLVGCPKSDDKEMLLPQAKSLQAVNCEVRTNITDNKTIFDVYFNAWYQSPIKDVPEGQEKHAEPDWEYWYSRRHSRLKAKEDCTSFYIKMEKEWKKYQKELKK